MWQPEGNLSCYFSGVIHFNFKAEPVTDPELNKLSGPMSEPQEPTDFCMGITSVYHHTCPASFTWFLRIKLRSSCLQGKHLTDKAISLASCCPIFVDKEIEAQRHQKKLPKEDTRVQWHRRKVKSQESKLPIISSLSKDLLCLVPHKWELHRALDVKTLLVGLSAKAAK